MSGHTDYQDVPIRYVSGISYGQRPVHELKHGFILVWLGGNEVGVSHQPIKLLFNLFARGNLPSGGSRTESHGLPSKIFIHSNNVLVPRRTFFFRSPNPYVWNIVQHVITIFAVTKVQSVVLPRECWWQQMRMEWVLGIWVLHAFVCGFLSVSDVASPEWTPNSN